MSTQTLWPFLSSFFCGFEELFGSQASRDQQEAESPCDTPVSDFSLFNWESMPVVS